MNTQGLNINGYLKKMTAFRRLCVLCLVFFTTAINANSFSSIFNPATVGPGNISQFVLTIDNTETTPIENISFSYVLPAGMTHVSPLDGITTCSTSPLSDLTIDGTTLSFSDYSLAANSNCTITINIITTTAPGSLAVPINDFSSSIGSLGIPTANLIVDTQYPSYSLSFSDTEILQGGVTTLTGVIDASLLSGFFNSFFGSINLPTGLIIADTPNVSTDCPQGITVSPGSASASFPNTTLLVPNSCTFNFDVKPTSTGDLTARTSINFGPGGAAFIDVGRSQATIKSLPAFAQMSFSSEPVSPGGTTSLTFTLSNFNRDDITNISFTNDLNAVVPGLALTGVLPTEPCGIGSSVSGTGLLTFTAGSLTSGNSCTFSVDVLVPVSASFTTYINTTSAFNYDLAASPVASINPISSNLIVSSAPQLSLQLLPNPVLTGDVLTARFNITNVDTVNSATNINFLSELTTFLPYPITIGTLPSSPCGAGSSVALTFIGTERQGIELTAGSIVAGSSCTFDVGFTIPIDMSAGRYTMQTQAITATVSGATVTGNAASDVFDIITGPSLSITFDNTDLILGGTVLATFTLNYDFSSPTNATNISFTTDLEATTPAALTGFAVSSTGFTNNTCNGSTLSGTSIIDFSGGIMTAGESCSFDVELDVPAVATPALYTLNSSLVTSTVSSSSLSGGAGSVSFNVSGLSGSLSSTPVDVSGGNSDTSTLSFTIENAATATDATGILFTFNLNGGSLTGLSAVGAFPTDPCGAGSSLTGTTLIIFQSGNLVAGDSCTFDITVNVPSTIQTNSYAMVSSAVSSSPASGFTFNNNLVVNGDETPSVTITSSSAVYTNLNPFNANIQFSEGVATFDINDINVTNASLSNFVTVSSSEYTVDVSASTDGVVELLIPSNIAVDLGANMNGNLASNLFSIQYSSTVVLPAVIIASPSASIANTGPVEFELSFSGAPTEVSLASSDVILTDSSGGTATASIAISGGTTLNPKVILSSISGNGTLVISIKANVARNSLGSTLQTSNSSSFIVDNIAPSVVITTSSVLADPTKSPFNIVMTFSENVTGLVASDVSITNAQITGFGGSLKTYTATITPTSSGAGSISIAALRAIDAANNGNTASNTISTTYDLTAPTGYSVTINTPQIFINSSNDNAFQFNFSGAEVGSSYSFTITDGSTTSTAVTGNITATTGSFTGIDVSSFNEGTLTLNFNLTDPLGNIGVAVSDTIVKQYNNAPVITEGATISVNMSEDSSPTAFSLSLNATDAEFETIEWSILSAASNGSASVSGTGNSKIINYIPLANYFGTDSFVVEVTDNNSLDPLTNSIIVTVIVSEENDVAVIGLNDMTPTQGQLLTATITDTDGFSGVVTYQWMSGVNNVGTNSSNYLTTQQDVGQAIRVSAVYVDDSSNNEAPISSVSALVTNVNDIGNVTIDNTTPSQGDVLTASVADIDGVSSTVNYQWASSGLNVGANSVSYTTNQSDVGNNLTVVATYTDDFGSPETITSLATANVINVNDAPVITEGATISVNMSEDSSPTAFSLSLNATDAEFETIEWSILSAASNGSASVSGTGNSKIINYIPLANYFGTDSFVVEVTDNNSLDPLTSSIIVTVIIAGENDIGVIGLNNITPIQGQLLTATIIDADGFSGSVTYQWISGVNNVGTNSSSYVTTQQDVGQSIRVSAVYVDDSNNNETPITDTSAIVTNVNDVGQVTIDNTAPFQGSLLTATVTDEDGLTGTINYQWLSGGNNVGMNQQSYQTTESDVGLSMAVTATYTDDFANQEIITSLNTTAVINVNDPPVFTSQPVMTANESSVYQYIISATDQDDNDSLVISATVLPAWLTLTDNGDGSALLTGTPQNADIGAVSISLVVTDLSSQFDTQVFSLEVFNINSPVQGKPIIIGELLRTSVLTATTTSISDDDGLGPFNYQWLRSGVSIAGATSSSYLLGDDDVWQIMRVVVSFTDLQGINETISSDETTQIFDLDSDGDGIYDLEEGTGDSDGDGIPDYLDTDSDNDGIPDSVEGTGDSDGDGIPNYLDTSLDEDGDGIPDALEGGANQDSDGDGLIDALDPDSDNDGISDFEESGASGLDTDGDGIDDAFDVDQTGGVDADGDGIDDDVTLLDSDGDGIPDYLDRDSDNDSVPDALENSFGHALKNTISSSNKSTDLAASDIDGDGIINTLDSDSDNDGISDLAEAATDYVDSDLDQIIDEFDVDFTGGIDENLDGVDDAAVLLNTDNDITPNMFDLDSDNDGINDVNEAQINDLDYDGLADDPIDLTNDPIDTDMDSIADYLDLDSNNDDIYDIANGGAASLDLDGNGQIDDASNDADRDGIIDAMDEEVNQFGTKRDRDGDGVPSSVDLDDDNDGISDIVEGSLDTDSDSIINSLDSDSDNDGLSDLFEANRNPRLGVDSDNDGIDDQYDVDILGGTDENDDGIDDSLTELDSDNNGVANYIDIDSDGDGISDTEEQLLVVLLGIDSDLDGLDDAVDVDVTGGVDENGDGQDDSTISMDDLDNDGLLAYLDTDTDGDGIPDGEENVDANNDGINDRLQAAIPEPPVERKKGGGSFDIFLLLFLLMSSLALIHYRQRKTIK